MRPTCLLFLWTLALAFYVGQCWADHRAKLDFSKVGVYGTLFDFCDYSVFKLDATEDSKTLAAYRRIVHEAFQRGKLNLVGLYGIREAGLTSLKRLEKFNRGAERVLAALDHKEVYAAFIDEENVTWGGGLEALNSAYAYLKERYPQVSFYQWLTNPDVPHPKLRADGWIIDPYGMDTDRFRRYLMKYLITGRPVIDCITTSPDPGAPWGPTCQQQVDVCREFNVPMFFYCVDNKWGSPDIWLHSDDLQIARPRRWLMGVVSEAHNTDTTKLPLASADYSWGRPVEVAGDAANQVEFTERFANTGFIDDAAIRGFRSLKWDGEKETLNFAPRSQKDGPTDLIYHFISDFELSDIEAELKGQTRGVPLSVAISITGHNWPHSTAALPSKDAKPRDFAIRGSSREDARFKGKEFWVCIKGGSVTNPHEKQSSLIKTLTVRAHMTPPAKREVNLASAPNGSVRYLDDFQSPKYLHVAFVDNGKELTWTRGRLSTHGVSGAANLVRLRWKFVSDAPLHDILVRADCFANDRNLGSVNRIAVSLDGEHRLVEESTRGKPTDSQGSYNGPLRLDLSKDSHFASVKEFWVHVNMQSNSGVKTGDSNSLNLLEVTAKTAGAR